MSEGVHGAYHLVVITGNTIKVTISLTCRCHAFANWIPVDDLY